MQHRPNVVSRHETAYFAGTVAERIIAADRATNRIAALDS